VAEVVVASRLAEVACSLVAAIAYSYYSFPHHPDSMVVAPYPVVASLDRLASFVVVDVPELPSML
jgi:hypothetical protein